MNTNQILAVAAAIQVALVAYSWWPAPTVTSQTQELIELPGAIDAITIRGTRQPGDSEPEVAVALEKRDGSWVVANAHGYPADEKAVQELLDKVGSIPVRSPVATRAASHTSLNVADDDHARTLELGSGGSSMTLILGAASGQASNIRRSDDPTTWSIKGWNPWAIGDKTNRFWQGRMVDGLTPETLDSLTVVRGEEGFTLERSPDGEWTAAGQTDFAVDGSEVDAMLRRLGSLYLDTVVGQQALGPAGTRVEWTGVVGEQTFRGALSVADSAGGKTTVQLEGSPWVVQVPTTSVSRWTEITLQDLEAQPELQIPPNLGRPPGHP